MLVFFLIRCRNCGRGGATVGYLTQVPPEICDCRVGSVGVGVTRAKKHSPNGRKTTEDQEDNGKRREAQGEEQGE